MLKVLVVDDQASVRTALEVLLDVFDIPVVTASSPEEALDLVTREDLGVVIQDMNFRRDTTSGVEGVELMRAIRRLDPDLPIVLMTAFTSLEMAVQLVKEGANDYIAKPWDDDKLVAVVKNLLRMRQLQQENLRLTSQGKRARRELQSRSELCGVVYESTQMHEVVSLAAKVAPSNAAVLITGPNGSGKEKIAEIVQANSRRRSKPFVKVNSGGLHDNLIDAELFGAEAGAFTGAVRTRIGRFEEADGATLFLDEIGNLSAGAQMKLLRVLQTGELQRLGSNVTRRVDVRVISATNADLPRAIREGTFREDLYFRLNVIEIAIPPLRDRPDDILPLAEHFLQRAARGEGTAAPVLRDDATQALLGHEWPGNVRELENRMQRALLVHRDGCIRCEDLGLSLGTHWSGRTDDPARGEAGAKSLATGAGRLAAREPGSASESSRDDARPRTESTRPQATAASSPATADVPVPGGASMARGPAAGSPALPGLPSPAATQNPPAQAAAAIAPASASSPAETPARDATRDPSDRDAESAEIEGALLEARGVVSRAAAHLGISRQALYRRMERLGIELERRPTKS